MTSRFSRAEYWLLDVAVDECVPIANLINGDAALGLNRTDHQCSAKELADALEVLFANRYIKSFRAEGRRAYRVLDRSQIEVELHRPKLPSDPDDPFHIGRRHPDETYYKLTPRGGAAWESFARPDWSHFVEGAGWIFESGNNIQSPPYHCRGRAISSDPRRLELYLSLAVHIGHHIDKNSIRLDKISPWKATYWKTRPLGHRARFKMIYHDVYTENHGWTEAASNTFRFFGDWYRWRA